MGKAFVLGFVTAIATMTAAVCFFVMSGALPAGQDSKLSRLEKWVAKRSLEATMRREAQGLESPFSPQTTISRRASRSTVSTVRSAMEGPRVGFRRSREA